MAASFSGVFPIFPQLRRAYKRGGSGEARRPGGGDGGQAFRGPGIDSLLAAGGGGGGGGEGSGDDEDDANELALYLGWAGSLGGTVGGKVAAAGGGWGGEAGRRRGEGGRRRERASGGEDRLCVHAISSLIII